MYFGGNIEGKALVEPAGKASIRFLHVIVLLLVLETATDKSRTNKGQFPLAKIDFVMQSRAMETKWAEENLQTIRTLMERSALYRRALAPIMLFAGALGVVAAGAGVVLHLDSTRTFGGLWLGTAIIVVAGAFIIARRQALKDQEPFWSPPTWRVAQALFPPLLAGLCLSLLLVFAGGTEGLTLVMTLMWMLFYGFALHSAGFFMPRGIMPFAWIYIVSSCNLFCISSRFLMNSDFNVNWLMGFFFGVLHLAYGAYLYLTEKGKNAA